MPIVGNENYNPAMFLEEVPAAPSEVFGSAVKQALLDNPTQRIATEYQFYSSEKKAKEEKLPMISKEEATRRASEMGVEIHNLPKNISEDGFKILSERQYQRKVMDISVSSGDSVTAKLAGGLLGSLADPINVAFSFAPVPGLGALTSQLSKAGTNLFTKSLLRAQIGAVEGAVGAAAIESLINIPIANKIGDDYGLTDSAINIMTGAIGGALLHPAFGAAKDLLDPRLNAVLGMSPETKGDYAQTVMSQGMDDRPINTSFMDVVRAKELSSAMENIEKAHVEAKLAGDEESLRYLDTQKKVIEEEMHTDMIKTLSKMSEIEIENLQKTVNGGKGDRYASQKDIESQDLEIKESVYDDVESNVEAIAQEETMTLKENAKQMEVEVNKILEADDAYIKEVKDFSDSVKAFAKCITRGS